MRTQEQLKRAEEADFAHYGGDLVRARARALSNHELQPVVERTSACNADFPIPENQIGATRSAPRLRTAFLEDMIRSSQRQIAAETLAVNFA